MKVSTRITLVALLPLIALAVSVVLSARSTRELMLDEKKVATRHAVETVWSVIAHYESLAAAGAMSRDEAKKKAIAAVRELKYEQKEYFWLNDMQPTMVMHPTKPELDGKDISGIKDPDGQAIFLSMVKVVRESGAGYVSYAWPKPGADKPMPKISYVKAFAPWGWVVGSGIYVDEVDTVYHSRLIRDLAGVLVGTLLLVGAIFGLSRGITVPLREAVAHAARIGSGDLTGRIDATGRDETAALLQSLDRMQSSLRSTVGDIRRSAGSMAIAASEIAQGSADLSGRTSSQAASLEETAASMEELTATVKQNAENAMAANQLSSNAADVAGRGADVVRRAVGAMTAIDDSAKKIVDIIAVIDGIAFQTNILALNAAVEASRAGDQGRGFAVVAGEVRNLAQRSSTAAKEIKTLIGASAEHVEQGSDLVHAAGKTMEEVQAAVRKVNDLVTEIATASREQGSGIEQVAQAIGQIDDTTQQNAALVEETAAAAENLRQLAGELDSSAAKFRFESESAGGHDDEGSARSSTVDARPYEPVRLRGGNRAGDASRTPLKRASGF